MGLNIFFCIAIICSISIALVASLSAVNLINMPDEYHLKNCTISAVSSAGTNLTFILNTVNGPAILRDSVPVSMRAPVGSTVPCIVTWYGLTGRYDPPFHIAVLGRIYVKIPANATYDIIIGVLSIIILILELTHWILSGNLTGPKK